MNSPIKVLVTGAGAPGGPGIIQSLKSEKCYEVFGADIDQFATGKFMVEKFFQIPRPENQEFIPTMLDICEKNKIDVIVPLVTKELFKFSECKSMFSNKNVKVVVSDNQSLVIANDKGKLYETLSDTGVELPNFYIAQNKDQLVEAAKKLGYPRKTIVIKPSIGNGSRGIRIINSNKNKFDLLFNEKPNNLYCSFEDYIDAISDNNIPELVISEFLPGDEITVDCIVDNGKAKLILIRNRDNMREGISVAGHFISSDFVLKQVKLIISKLPGLNGPIGFQFKKSKSGTFALLESNPRLQGTSVAASGLGLNYPHQAINSCLGKKIGEPKKKSGVYFKRYYQEIFYEL